MSTIDHVKYYLFTSTGIIALELLVYVVNYTVSSFKYLFLLFVENIRNGNLHPRLFTWIKSVPLNNGKEAVSAIRIASSFIIALLSSYLFLDGNTRLIHLLFIIALLVIVPRTVNSKVMILAISYLTAGVKASIVLINYPIYYVLLFIKFVYERLIVNTRVIIHKKQ